MSKRQVRFGSALTAVGLYLFVGMIPIASAADLLDLPETDVGCELNDEQMLEGISRGLANRTWLITSNDGGGNLVAQVIVRARHTLIVDIAYTDSSYKISYKDSDNLDYNVRRNGRETIHRNANSWMENIQADIAAQLSALCVLQ